MSGIVGKVIPRRSGSLKSISAGTLDYVLDGSYEPDHKKNREIIEGLISKCLFFSQSPKFILNGLLNLQIRRLLWVEMWAAAKSLERCRTPIKHFMFSTKNRLLSHQEFDQASKLISETLGVNDCLWVSSAHRDTKNFHIHFVVVTEKLTASDHELVTINNRWTWRACQRVCARMCHEFKIQPLANAMFEFRPAESNPSNVFKLFESHYFLRTPYQPNHPIVYREKDIKVSLNRVTKACAPLPENLIQYELRTGRKSLIRLAQENLTPHLQRLLSAKAGWSEMHRTLLALGWEVIPTDVGRGVLLYGSKAIKLSSLGNQFSMNRLEQRFGPFEPASNFGLSRCLDFGLPVEPITPSQAFDEFQEFLAGSKRYQAFGMEYKIFVPKPRSFEEFKLGFAKESVVIARKHYKHAKPTAQKLAPYIFCMNRGGKRVYFDMRESWPQPLFIDTGNQIRLISKNPFPLSLGLLLASVKWSPSQLLVKVSDEFKQWVSAWFIKMASIKRTLSRALPLLSVSETSEALLSSSSLVSETRSSPEAFKKRQMDDSEVNQDDSNNDDEQGSHHSI